MFAARRDPCGSHFSGRPVDETLRGRVAVHGVEKRLSDADGLAEHLHDWRHGVRRARAVRRQRRASQIVHIHTRPVPVRASALSSSCAGAVSTTCRAPAFKWSRACSNVLSAPVDSTTISIASSAHGSSEGPSLVQEPHPVPGNDEAPFTVRILLINHDRFPISPVHRIKAQEIDEVFGVDQIIDRDDFELWPAEYKLDKRAPDATESIHRDSGQTRLLTGDAPYDCIYASTRVPPAGRASASDCRACLQCAVLRRPCAMERAALHAADRSPHRKRIREQGRPLRSRDVT